MIGITRWFVASQVALAFAAVDSAQPQASYPEHTVHIIAGEKPGGGTDFSARMVAEKLSEKWGQPVVVETRAGSSSMIAADFVAHAQPDGYTIFLASSDHVITPGQYKLNYDPIKGFAPIILFASVPEFLVINPSVVPVKTLEEFIAKAKAAPQKITYASPGGMPFVSMSLLMKRTGTDMLRVNYTGSGAAIVAMLSGEVQSTFTTIVAVLGQLKAGKLKALAVSSNARSPLAPEVPTIAEAADMPDFNVSQWYGVLAPAGTPKAIVDKIHDDLQEALKSSDVQQRLNTQGFLPAGGSSEDFANKIKTEIPQFATVLKMEDTK